jgi:hypothetical protein
MKKNIFFLSAFLYLNFANCFASEVVENQVEENINPAKKVEAEKKKVIPIIEDRFLFRFEKLTRMEKGL